MTYSLAIFDLDGTVLYTLTDLEISLNHALTSRGFPPRTTDEVRRFIGDGMLKLVERAVPPHALAEEQKTVYAAMTAHYAVHCADHTHPYEGILPLLDALQAAGMRLAVVSNKDDYAVRELCQHYFPGKLDFAVGRRDGIPKKPAPDLVHLVLKDLGIAPTDAVYIGDSDVDVDTARNAGMDAVSVTWGYRDVEFLRAHGATSFVHTPEELGALLLSTPKEGDRS